MLTGSHNRVLRVDEVRSRIARAAQSAGRDPASVTLIAVSKAKPAEDVRSAATAGVTDFGENYVKEALGKMDELASLPLRWHFIGQIQANKTRLIAERFAWVHGIDRIGIARRLSEQRPHHAPPLDACIQVALVPEPGKGGVAPALLETLAREAATLPKLTLRGLMCVPPASTDLGEQRARFAQLRRLLETLNANGLSLDTLSMGMSDDFEAAIAEGATHVRIGRALFGERI
jgi:pyridoxal phosphate enzyme (YggS family)